ncbi:hypothetical protein B0H17DRAFT_1141332 [Mycena rosella]|uniref:UvrD-like helicase ATP-binding domain-containing protein n=1 Tax=Mycena rosella TaxID=1033263 RepID=A0AAD7GA92_MYCRO|nr:hypothetical protein B0H17DRAFT_1141332 [Mycena rosella]
MVPPRKASYRGDLFDSAALTSLEAVENAAFEFQAIVNDANSERIFNEVMLHERPAVARLVFSCVNDELIMNRFPTTPEAFGDSLVHKILSQLSLLFLFAPAQSVSTLHEHHQQLVKEAPEVLAAIASKAAMDGIEPDPTSGGKKISQKKAKLARRVAAQGQNALDPAPFERLSMAVPETRTELEKGIEIILATQRSILKVYLESLRLPAVSASIRAACVHAEAAANPASEGASDSEAGSGPQPSVDFPTVPYSSLQPIKFSTLYRRRATGFGDWDITIAQRAERDLREYNRRDRKTFIAIVKKMRDLSNGDFSGDNYNQINDGNVELPVPIYEAKVTEELRLVYQVDCVPQYDTKSEQQVLKVETVLKVFGIYEHQQLSRGSFWHSMSRALEKKGEEYTDRCSRRQQPVGLGTPGSVFIPLTFPARGEDVRVRASLGSVPDLPSDDAEQIQSLLLKTVHFSQPLLESIIADLDVAFVLEISPNELEIIESPHSCYVLGRSGTGKTTTMLYKMLLVEASSLESSAPGAVKSRQLFVTQSRILAEKVGEHFAKLLSGHRPSAVSEILKAGKKADRVLVADEERDWRSDLPRKYSDLQDTDFPLFVSFEQLCSMIERDIEADTTQTGIATSARLTFEKFKSEYWPHFPQPLCKGLEPSMVFSEFLGVIMGSEKALASKSYFLDRDAYLNLGERGQSTFADQRERIYDLFENGSVMLDPLILAIRQVDLENRTRSILKSFQAHGVPGKKVDYLYVDETQDNLLVDTLLLRFLCQNANGLFWAGDTAQTISVGSSFRFNELKAFLFRIEERRQRKHPELGFQPTASPRSFQLTVNYRSHTGIVNCAHSVIEIITKLWPNAIDILDRERGTVDGLRPIFFINWDSQDVQSKQFLFGDQPSGRSIELGAHQCILVRDNTAKENLQAQVGEIGLIFTLHESKGLEFNDVLLYNFFEDSSVSEAQWRVVLNIIENRVVGSAPAPAFDGMRHASVCTELKFLYVAITRARNNLWIADCSTKGEPMRTLWTSKDQLQNCVLGIDTPRFAMSSTPAEWQERGRQLFENKRLSQARLCYERAYMPHEAAIAKAYHLRERASEMPNTLRRDAVTRKAAFLEVATAFVECAKNDTGAGAEAYFRTAGECFEQGDDLTHAIDAYSEARYFSRVAELYRTLGKFDEAVATIRNHSQEIDSWIAEKIISVARLFYFKKGQIQKAGRLFERHEEALEYLEDRGLNVERAALLELLQNLSEAAEIHLNEGRTSKAIALFIQDHNTDRASECILQGLWEKFSFAVVPAQDPAVVHLLELASRIDVSLLSLSNRDEISMFQAIAKREISKLQLLAESFFAGDNSAVALLCLDHCFTNPPKIQALQVDAVAKDLQVFYTYVKLLHHFAFGVDPCNSPAAEKLFGYRKEGENNYSIAQGTFLHLAFAERPSDGNIILAGSEIRALFQKVLRDRLAKRVGEENEMCRITKAFEGPCPTYALFNGHCNRLNCPQEHILASSFGREKYTLRVRIHLQQILIYQSLQNIDWNHLAERRNWLLRLYAVLNPPSHRLGSAASLDFNLIPEAEAALQVVKEWIRSWSYTLEFAPELHFLTHMVQLARLGFEFDGKHAMFYLTRSPFMMNPKKPLIYRRPPEGRYVVGDFLYVLDDQYEWCLAAGVTALQHIIKSNLSIHVNVLCDVAEHLCAELVVADRERFGPVHDTTLPLSWLVKHFSAAGGPRGGRDTNTFWLLAQCLSQLLEPVCSGVEYLLYENKNLAHQALGFMIRNIVLARICLCLLAYNFRSYRLRDDVLNWITSLRRRDPTRRFTALCTKYVEASSWASITRAVRSSTDGSTLDEMVQLLYVARPQPRAVRGVRQIVYGKFEDIPRLLGASSSIASYYEYQTAPVAPVPQMEQREDRDDAPDDSDADADERLPNDAPLHMPPTSVLEEPVAPSEEELAAAATIRKAILRAHRRVEQHTKGARKSSLAAGLSEFFAECRSESATMDRPYRVYFLGPLPHLLLCLDIVHTRAQKEAKQMKKELNTAEHEALEILDKKLTDVQHTLKMAIKYQKALKPIDGIRAKRNLTELKKLAGEAVEVLQALPFTTPPGLGNHIDIAYKGFVQPWATVTRRAEPKPKLNTEEMY